ncbi:hypothetical protein BHE74_00042654 [Ensete ventricosum]|nr:hypothetical protein BHE74_00042654 [Ensete ventricosum]
MMSQPGEVTRVHKIISVYLTRCQSPVVRGVAGWSARHIRSAMSPAAPVRGAAGGSARCVCFAMGPATLPQCRAPAIMCAIDRSRLQIFQLSLPRLGRHPNVTERHSRGGGVVS